jgi:hypothetical protein
VSDEHERPGVAAADEARHQPGSERLWNESWYFDFVVPDGSLGGWVRLGLYPNVGIGWYHALVCGPGRPTVAVADLAVPLPTGAGLEVRAHGLWADHIGTHPLERWQVANEAHGVAVDDPAELYRDDGGRGDPTPMGLDLDWETDGEPYHYGHTTRYEVPCLVHGEVLLGSERIEVDGFGQRDHSWGERDWWRFGWVWTSGRLGDGTRVHGADIRIPELRLGFGYLQPPEGPVVAAAWPDATDGSVRASEELGPGGFPVAAEVSIAGLDLAVDPVAFAPALLLGPDGQRGRLLRALCRYTAADGRTGHGWTEWNQPATTASQPTTGS